MLASLTRVKTRCSHLYPRKDAMPASLWVVTRKDAMLASLTRVKTRFPRLFGW